jgi:teichuronic acid biosynthesis glycosyltransferase TuaG
MNTNNSIDIIIPVKERYKLLLSALSSIENQTIIPDRVWIIDDCSNEKIDKFKKYKFPITLIRNEINKGPSYSCNLAAKKSNSKYIAILETDDLWKPTKIEKQLNKAKEKDLDFIYCNYLINNKENKQKFSNDKNVIFSLLLKMWSCPNPSTFFFKREAFLSLNGFDESMIGTHDHDLWIRICQSNIKFDYVDECLVEIENYNPDQMSRDYKQRIKSISHFCMKHKNLITKHKNRHFFEIYKRELLARALIPGLKKSLKNKDILGLIKILKYLIFSKIFYRRVLKYLIR